MKLLHDRPTTSDAASKVAVALIETSQAEGGNGEAFEVAWGFLVASVAALTVVCDRPSTGKSLRQIAHAIDPAPIN